MPGSSPRGARPLPLSSSWDFASPPRLIRRHSVPALASQVRDDLPGQGGTEAGHGAELLGLQGGDALDGTEAHQQLGRTRLSDAGHVLQGRPAQPSGPRVAMRRDGVAMDLVPQALEKLQDGVAPDAGGRPAVRAGRPVPPARPGRSEEAPASIHRGPSAQTPAGWGLRRSG